MLLVVIPCSTGPWRNFAWGIACHDRGAFDKHAIIFLHFCPYPPKKRWGKNSLPITEPNGFDIICLHGVTYYVIPRAPKPAVGATGAAGASPAFGICGYPADAAALPCFAIGVSGISSCSVYGGWHKKRNSDAWICYETSPKQSINLNKKRLLWWVWGYFRWCCCWRFNLRHWRQGCHAKLLPRGAASFRWWWWCGGCRDRCWG